MDPAKVVFIVILTNLIALLLQVPLGLFVIAIADAERQRNLAVETTFAGSILTASLRCLA